MEPFWAEDNLRVIRTLMERAATYRRALAPIMLLLGCLGLAAALLGWFFPISAPRPFVLWWLGASLISLIAAYLLARRQALGASEPFWSPPTRRITHALLPPLFVGFIAGLLMIVPTPQDILLIWWLPPLWMGLYGCALHAAGFFTQRGLKLFGTAFLVSGLICGAWLARAGGAPPLRLAHAVMAWFGLMHLAYGVYLYFTETKSRL